MESSKCTSPIPFKSKKQLVQSTPNKPAKTPSRPEMILETPEKSNRRSTRVRNQNMALSVQDIKRTAQSLHKRAPYGPDQNPDPLMVHRSGKRSQTPDRRESQRSVNLPEKYMMLCEFFNVIVSVIPLLRMRKKASTFSNIRPKIQSLTDRRFSMNHLAQLKYILPEAIVVKRIQVWDELTDCMKEELLITLVMEAVKCSKNLKDIRELFKSRMEEYYKAHTEESDIPEAELPALFYHSNYVEPICVDSHNSVAASVSDSNSLITTPIKSGSKRVIDIQGTPLKETRTPIRLMSATPAMQPSKRCYTSLDNDDVCDVPTKLVRRPSRSLSAEFDHLEDNAESEVQGDGYVGSNIDSDINDMIPKNLLLSVREKERKILEEQDPAISLARRRHQLMSSLPKLFDITRLLFQSISRSVMTKEELLYKIIAGHSDVVDRGEVEEQFKLLQELAPEYISERVCQSGGILVSVNKSVCAQSVRAKFLEA